MRQDIQLELLGIYETYPGILTQTSNAPASHIHLHEDDEDCVVVMLFEKSTDGRVAELVVDHILCNNQEKRFLIGAKKDPSLACGCSTDGAMFYACSKERLEVFAGYLDYASHRPMGHARPATVLSSKPLSILLSHAFVAFARDYRQVTSDERIKPQLGVWSNVLRWIGKEGLDQRMLKDVAILSQRAMKVAVRNVEEQGWLSVEKVPKVRGLKQLQLTAEGRHALDIGAARIDAVEWDWCQRFGTPRINALRSSLAAVASQLEIEFPHYLTGYGPADPSLTGGGPVPAQPGPPGIPAHGQEWPVVIRDPDSDIANLPLPALLSKLLAAFTIDYDGEGGMLSSTSQLLQYIGDEGTTLGLASEFDVKGNGKSLLERHLVVVVEPGKPKDLKRRVYLTPKGKRARDAYAHLVMEIEQRWQARYGADHVDRLRTALASLDSDFDQGLPDYPNTTAWFYRWKWGETD